MDELRREMDAQKAQREELVREQEKLAVLQRRAAEQSQQGRAKLADLEVELRRKMLEDYESSDGETDADGKTETSFGGSAPGTPVPGSPRRP